MTEAAAVQAPCPWHRETLAQLFRRREEGRLPHALLLAGPAGIGKSRLALALVQLLFCEAPRGGLACGRCHGCHMSTAGTHPDLYLAEPAEQGKAIRIDQVRELVDFASRTAQYGGYRVALIMPAQAMNRAAQNALLKTLEEPGANTLILLVCDQISQLLPTVRSRCQRQLLPAPPSAQAEPWLAQQLAVPERAAPLLVAAGGAPLKALALEQADWFASRASLVQALARLTAGQASVVVVARQLAEHDTTAVLEACYGWVWQALRMAQGDAPVADAELLKPLQQLARAPAMRLLDFAQALARARRLWLSGANPNRELLLEQALMVLAGQLALPA